MLPPKATKDTPRLTCTTPLQRPIACRLLHVRYGLLSGEKFYLTNQHAITDFDRLRILGTRPLVLRMEIAGLIQTRSSSSRKSSTAFSRTDFLPFTSIRPRYPNLTVVLISEVYNDVGGGNLRIRGLVGG